MHFRTAREVEVQRGAWNLITGITETVAAVLMRWKERKDGREENGR